MGSLRRLLTRARKRCACHWYTTAQGTDYCHTCVCPPGHPAGHSCANGEKLAQEVGAA